MKWAEITVRVAAGAADIVAEIFTELGANGAVIEDPAVINEYIDEGRWDYRDIERKPVTGVVTVKAYLNPEDGLDWKIQELERRLLVIRDAGQTELGPGEVSQAIVDDADWADRWKDFFHVEKIGRRVVIKPTWEEYAPQGDEVVVELDPGAAFGTGTHPSTAMCIRALESLVPEAQARAKQQGHTLRVFDVGTGSGVLAITAAKLGATGIEAADYDATAVHVAEENIAQNGLAGEIKTGVSDILKSFTGQADLVIANIIADIIIRMFDELDEHLAPGGRLLTSGIIDERQTDVVAAARQHGFVVAEEHHLKGWTSLVLCRETEI